MLLDLVIREGSVGDVLLQMTRVVPDETGSLGQNKIKSNEWCYTNAIVRRDCPDSGTNNEIVPGCEARNNI